jgi:OmpR-family two-component system manganese-sensing sensor histidine kinase
LFDRIRHRLLCSYLLGLASILICFALAVRVLFTRSLTQQLQDKLILLGQNAVASAEYEKGKIKLEDDFSHANLDPREQSLQWFDRQARLLATQGASVIDLPLFPSQTVQFQSSLGEMIAVTLPIWASDERQVVGYVRVSQSLAEFEETIQKLDWGLGGGVSIALILSGISGIWLTRQAMRPIEASFQRLQQFTADASHELRGPLMAIKSNTSVALKYSQGIREIDREKFEAIASATEQMTHLTEDLLFLARTDSLPHAPLDRLNLTDSLDRLALLYKPQAEGRQIAFNSSIEPDLILLGDRGQISRLFRNLVSNAIAYTENGGSVTLIAHREGNEIVIEVRDTGIGIASENIERIFDRFWRENSSRSYHSGGTGLGLAIVRAIVHHHQGQITVNSQIGFGSCFRVIFPSFSP